MQKKYKIFLFLLLPLISITFLSCISSNGSADTPSENISKAILDRINLEITPKSGQFDNFWNYEKDVYEVSDVYTIPNPVEVGEDYAYFESHIKIKANSRIFTLYGRENTYWNAQATSVKYAWLLLSLDPTFSTPNTDRTEQYYYVYYNDYKFSKHLIYQNYIKASGYDGYFNVKFTMDDFNTAYGITEEGETVSFSIPEMYPIKCSVLEGNTEKIGEYSDEFGDFGETQVTVTDFRNLTPTEADKTVWDEEVSTVTNTINAYVSTGSIGVHETNKPKTFTIDAQGLPLGQEEIKYTYRGDLTRTEPYIFEMRAKNRPRVDIYEQEIFRNQMVLGVDTKGIGAGIRDISIGTGERIFRHIGWHITEYSQRQTYEVTFVAKCKVEASPIELQRLLAHPLVEQGDVIWNIAMTGNDTASIFVEAGLIDKIRDLFSNNRWWIILIVVLVAIGIGSFYLIRTPMVQQAIGRQQARREITGKTWLDEIRENREHRMKERNDFKLGKWGIKRK